MLERLNYTYLARATGVFVVVSEAKRFEAILGSTMRVVIKSAILSEICGSNFV